MDQPVFHGHEELEAAPFVLQEGVGEHEEHVARLLHTLHHVLREVAARDEVPLVDAQRQASAVLQSGQNLWLEKKCTYTVLELRQQRLRAISDVICHLIMMSVVSVIKQGGQAVCSTCIQ